MARTVLRAVILRPGLWPVALGTLVRLAPDGWWRRWPPLPLPAAGYWHFRVLTAYGGSGDSVPSVPDVLAFLRWCRRTAGGLG